MCGDDAMDRITVCILLVHYTMYLLSLDRAKQSGVGEDLYSWQITVGGSVELSSNRNHLQLFKIPAPNIPEFTLEYVLKSPTGLIS